MVPDEMAKKKKPPKPYKYNTDALPIEYVSTYSEQNKIMPKCGCNKNGKCTILEGGCNPKSFKCKNNKVSHKNSVLASIPITNNSNRKVLRGDQNYVPYISERYGYNTDIETVEKSADGLTLYVFQGFLNLDKNRIKDVNIKIPNIQGGPKVGIYAAFYEKNRRYYISDTQLKWLHKQGLYPAARFELSSDGTKSLSAGNFNEYSILSLYGYSVGKNGMKKRQREELLDYLIKHKIVGRHDAIQHLQGFISLRETREDKDFTQAICDWKSDIAYINDSWISYSYKQKWT